MPAAAGTLPDYESFIAGQPDTFDWPDLDERTASSLCYTSGTTGHPKGVLYSHRSTVLHAYGGSLVDSMGLSSGDTVLAVVPMFHANAWGLPYNAGMTGTKLVLPGPKMGDAETLVDLMNTEAVTMAAGVPTVWTLLLNYLAQTGKKVPTLKKTLIETFGEESGAACSVDSESSWRRQTWSTTICGRPQRGPQASVSVAAAEVDLPAESDACRRHGIAQCPFCSEESPT